jgi:hypothetical protein
MGDDAARLSALLGEVAARSGIRVRSRKQVCAVRRVRVPQLEGPLTAGANC